MLCMCCMIMDSRHGILIVVHECMEDYVDNVRFEEEFYKNKEV